MDSLPHKFDKSNLRQAVFDAPGQFEVGFEIAKGVNLNKKFERATFHGEGGSAFPVSLLGVIIRDFFQKKKGIPFEIYQNHTYSLSAEDFSDSLNFFCSYSGNTEEAISALNAAIEKNLPAIGIACGGRVQEICEDNKIPFVKLPLPYPAFQPRMGTGYFVGAICEILINNGLVPDIKKEIISCVSPLVESMAASEQAGMQLADKIMGKTPVIWASQKYKELARVWSIKFNEHAKNPAFWNFFPELNHNSMVGYTHLGDRYFAIMLKDGDDEAQNLRRYGITADILKGYKMDSAVVEFSGTNVIEKIFRSIYMADFAAYYLALKNETDPTPVVMVEELKKRLQE